MGSRILPLPLSLATSIYLEKYEKTRGEREERGVRGEEEDEAGRLY